MATKQKTVVVNIRELQDNIAPQAVTVSTAYLDFLKEASEFIKSSEVDPKNVSTADLHSSTKAFFKNRTIYKKYVNELNLPIGLYNAKGNNLKNQLDVWYKRPSYGKADEFGCLTVLKPDPNLLGAVGEPFKLVDFAANAFNDLLVAYNKKRRDDPRSMLNQIKAVRAYEPPTSYEEYVYDQYALGDDPPQYRKFFEKVLKPNRFNSQIKGFEDFYNLFFAYIRNNGLFFTEPAYYESSHNSIYASGLVVDIVAGNKTSDNFKSKIINDVRFPVLNYVAKMHGFRVDPNNPWRLIADLSSDIMIEKYIKREIGGDIAAAVVAKVYKTHYEDVYKVENLMLFGLTLVEMYKRFISQYPAYSTYQADTNLKQLFQKEFQVVENMRPPIVDYIKHYYNWPDIFDPTTRFPKKLLADQYVDFRIMETGVKMSSAQRANLKKKFYSFLQIPNYVAVQTTPAGMGEVNPATKDVNLLNREAFYFLERSLGLPSSRNKKDLTSSSKGYIFIFGRGNPLFTPH